MWPNCCWIVIIIYVLVNIVAILKLKRIVFKNNFRKLQKMKSIFWLFDFFCAQLFGSFCRSHHHWKTLDLSAHFVVSLRMDWSDCIRILAHSLALFFFFFLPFCWADICTYIWPKSKISGEAVGSIGSAERNLATHLDGREKLVLFRLEFACTYKLYLRHICPLPCQHCVYAISGK